MKLETTILVRLTIKIVLCVPLARPIAAASHLHPLVAFAPVFRPGVAPPIFPVHKCSSLYESVPKLLSENCIGRSNKTPSGHAFRRITNSSI